MHFVAFEDDFSLGVVLHLEQDFGSDLVVLDSSVDIVHGAEGAAIVLDVASSDDEIGAGLHRQHGRPIIGHGRIEEGDGPSARHADRVSRAHQRARIHLAHKMLKDVGWRRRRRKRLRRGTPASLQLVHRIGVGVPIAAKDAVVEYGIVLLGHRNRSVESGARGSESSVGDEAAESSVILEQRIGDVEFGAVVALEPDQSAEEAATE